MERWSSKPIFPELERQFTNESEDVRKLERLNVSIIRALAHTIDAKDRYTSGHSQRVANYSVTIARHMGKSVDEQRMIYYAGLLHDVGKIRIQESVINKAGKLTDEEYEQMKIHPVTGYHILKDIYEDRVIASGAKFHHERYDGKGYPNGLSGENIPEIARIICVADAYDAMTSNRSYRGSLPQERVRAEIERGKGIQFDPAIADIMLMMIDEDKDYLMRQLRSPQKNILAVDDEPINLKMLSFILKDEPTYHLIFAKGGEEALDLLEKGPVDLILLDIKMPGMDGFETLRRIREKHRAHVVFMTADKKLETIQRASEMGVDDYITKPFMPLVLKEIVHSIISE